MESKSRYFLITKDPISMAQILVDDKFEPGIKEVIIGPCNDRPGSINLVIINQLHKKKQKL